MLNRTRKGDAGFSLIELLVVVIIIGILAAVAIPVYIGAQNNARDASVKSDLVNAKVAMVAAFTQDGEYPATIDDLYDAGFAPGTSGNSDYDVEFELFNVSDDSFCLRAWADTEEARDLWVTESSPVIGPISIADTDDRPTGCPTTG